MCRNITPADKRVQCSRCGEVANPTDGWEHGWPNYGIIELGFDSCIDWELLEDVLDDPMDRYHPLSIEIRGGKHPVVKKFGYQAIELQWSAESYPPKIKRDYRLCRECQGALIALIGKFFFGY